MDVGCGFIASLKATGMVGPVTGSNIRAIYDKSKQAYVGYARWDAQAARDGVAFLGKGSTGFLPIGVSYYPGVGFFGSDVYQWFVEKPIYGQPDVIDISYYEEIYGYQQPQNSGGLRLGSTNQLKKMIEQTSSACRSAVQKLLNEVAAETGSEFTSTDPLQLFNQIASQTGGGGIYTDITHGNMKDRLPADALRAYTPVPGGSGVAWSFWSSSEKNVQRISVLYLRYTNGTPKSIGLAMAGYLVTTIHEITHVARKDHKNVEHSEMNAAAVKLGAKSFDDYVEKNCVDKQFWGRP